MSRKKWVQLLIVAMALHWSMNMLGQEPEYDCLLLQARSDVTVQGRANIGGFQCATTPLTPDDPLPSCFLKTDKSIRITDVQFQIPVADFQCGNPIILQDLKNVLDESGHPYIEFDLTELLVHDVQGSFYRGMVRASTRVKGVVKQVEIPVEVDELGLGSYKVSGQLGMLLSWYGIPQPTRLFGLLTLEDEIEVCFELYFTKRP